MKTPTTQSILIVDPDSDFISWGQQHLAAPGIQITGATSAEIAMAQYEKMPADLAIIELRLGAMSGMKLLQHIRLRDPNAMVILTTGFPTTSAIIEAMKYGAFDFLRKESLSYELRGVVENALKSKDALDAAQSAAIELPSFPEELQKEHFIGASPAMQDVFKMVGRVSRSTAPVMITGESGVGKEIVAKAIHRFSMRSSNEFVAINCAAIPSNLLESELFGHEKGAFTGAVNRREGRFEQCTNGTLFLDEIGDMPLEVQSKILRVLQEGQFSRVGGNETLTTQARILAATNKNLEQEVSKGRFREDLFYRLNVVRIHIPPLRHRVEDIPILAKFFLQRLSGNSAAPHRFSDLALATLSDYHWPGNVRELENTIQRAIVLANTNLLLPRDIPLGKVMSSKGDVLEMPARQDLGEGASLNLDGAVEVLFRAAEADPSMELLPWLERELTLRAMHRTDNNQVRASKLLGITRATLRKRLERYQ